LRAAGRDADVEQLERSREYVERLVDLERRCVEQRKQQRRLVVKRQLGR